MRRRGFSVLILVLGLTLSVGWAQTQPNLVTTHQSQIDKSGYTQIDFALSEVPDKAMLAFDIRFEPRFV